MVQSQDIQDFPRTMRDSVTTLPYRAGGSSTLTAAQVATVVLVTDLRRFENTVAFVLGTHDGGDDSSTFTVSGADFIAWGVQIGDTLDNTNATDGLAGKIIEVNATSLEYDSDTAWDDGDEGQVDKTIAFQSARATEIRALRIVADSAIYVRFDGAVSDVYHDVQLAANEVYEVDNVRIVNRIVVTGTDATSTPTVRWTVWGV